MQRLTSILAIAAVVGFGGFGVTGRANAQDATELAPRPRPDLLGSDTSRLSDLIDGQASLPDAAPGDPETLLDANELDDLVAPIALYPDALLAQVLVAATYPLEVVKAARLLEASDTMTDDELSDAIADGDWDPSILVLLSGFPTVIGRMADDLEGTEVLGEAMLTQDDDVLAAVQRMRVEARTAGNLASNEAQVIDVEEDRIAIRPADPEVVYVPNYDPVTAYAVGPAPEPQTVRSQAPWANPIVAGAVAFGAAVLVDQVFGDDDDGGDDGDGWDDYWKRPRPIDWRDREFYPRRAAAIGSGDSWSRERDRYWDRAERRWRRDDSRDRARAGQRRDAIRWLERDSERRETRLKALRDRQREAREATRRQERTTERLREETRKAERKEAQAREARRKEAEARDSLRKEKNARDARREDREKERDRAARKEQREKERARATRQKEREKVQARAARQEEREKVQARAARQEERQNGQARAARKEEREKEQTREAQSKQSKKARKDCKSKNGAKCGGNN